MGIDQMKLHSVRHGYLKNLQRPTRPEKSKNRGRKRGYHGFTARHGVDSAGNAPGGG
ncbi:hypothetical protein F511_35967 [Dorcoceras hygrometricum]|uniref:Uncharacterized protein n=1 Tax=Dorcoceras hygrometricum TaxID=472368 RepID=A0A2Z7CJY9_9LAMI|nr:hypothetical protein F511_35967 [Dorcoceras hygrometricum]